MGNVVLKFDDIEPDRELVEIGGKQYELLTMDDFSLIEGSKLRKQMRVMAAANDEMTAEQVEEYKATVDSIVGKVLVGIDAEVVKGMKIRHKEALLTHFFNAVVAQRGAAKAKDPQKA